VASRTSPRKVSWLKRKKRVRARVVGTTDRPRLCIFRSNKHVYAQIIDDRKGVTLVATSTLSAEFKGLAEKTGGKAAATAVGEMIAKHAKDKGIESVVFDRNGFIYKKNGLVAALATGARSGGLKF
jgi:large subunit ribosomal protein L18